MSTKLKPILARRIQRRDLMSGWATPQPEMSLFPSRTNVSQRMFPAAPGGQDQPRVAARAWIEFATVAA